MDNSPTGRLPHDPPLQDIPYPEVRIGEIPMHRDKWWDPPYNLQIPFRNGWIALGTMGTSTVSGSRLEEEAALYRREVKRLTVLFMGARDLLRALKAQVALTDLGIDWEDTGRCHWCHEFAGSIWAYHKPDCEWRLAHEAAQHAIKAVEEGS